MKGGSRPLGYTILEVMIVLAISGVMFLIAATFINGKQQRAAFTQGVNELASRFQGVIEEVTDGQYSDIPFSCSYVSGTTLTISGGAGVTQGSNQACVFLGKFLHFGVGGDLNAYEVFSLAGARVDPNTGTPVVSLANAKLTPISGGGVDLTRNETIPQGLQFAGEKVAGTGGGSGFYGFGFMQGLGALDPVTNAYQSGSQDIALYFSPTLNTPQTEPAAITNIEAGISLAQSVNICVADRPLPDPNAKLATIVIGTNNNRLNADVQMGVSNC